MVFDDQRLKVLKVEEYHMAEYFQILVFIWIIKTWFVFSIHLDKRNEQMRRATCLLTFDFEHTRVTTSDGCMASFNRKSIYFMSCFAILYSCNIPETKQQSKQYISPRKLASEKTKKVLSDNIFVETGIWDTRDQICINYLQKGRIRKCKGVYVRGHFRNIINWVTDFLIIWRILRI